MPKLVAFSNKLIFGNRFSAIIDNCFCMVSKTLIDDNLNFDGTIDLSKETILKKDVLWSYIYYLYYYNNSSISEFNKMQDPKTGKADALLFYNAVRNTTDTIISFGQPLTTSLLIIFINNIINKYHDSLINPIIDYLNILINKRIDLHLSNIAIQTGKDSGFKIELDKEKMKNSNVKVNFSIT